MNRRTFLQHMLLTGVVSIIPVQLGTLLMSGGLPSVAASDADPLQFPVNNYSEATVTVTTSAGKKEVAYRLYKALPYVGKPIDVNYQSMNVKVPIKVDGKAVDATHAPILFVNSVGGYMSSNVNGGMGAGGVPNGGMMPGTPPADMGGNPPAGMAGGPGGNTSGVSRNTDLALAAGYVVVEPGARGRDNQAQDSTYFGKAPAAIVDLKAAVRYIRYNKGVMPGNPDWIVSTGVSAGGALSALLGASGSSRLYDAYFQQIGAADTDDSIFASADFCPITDLEHADMAYEWEWGTTPRNGVLVDQNLAKPLSDAFAAYLASLKLQGKNGAALTADNYGSYLVQTYLVPSANKYLLALADNKRQTYLANNPWITWANNTASFTFADYAKHVGRMKGLPAFDAFDLSAAENIEFGTETANARHFTEFSLRQATGKQDAQLDDDLKTKVNLMNPMYFIGQDNSGCAKHWWIRHGTADSNTALMIITDLAIGLENKGKDVNLALYWDAGHGADEDPEDFIAWIGKITGFTK